MSLGAAGAELPVPEPGRESALAFVSEHLDGLYSGPVLGSERFQGGQARADAWLAQFDVTGYAADRNEVLPEPRRGASALSPYIRHGLLTLREVWDHVEAGPQRDVEKFRAELLWQEYARHWYARLGRLTAAPTRHTFPMAGGSDHWDESMACMEVSLEELHDDGWLVNQARMWLSSHWSVRHGGDWRDGENEFFRHLLDGSRAANRLGWQWTTGVGSSKPYGFSRWQVEKRAPGLCASCDLVQDCPIEEWPENPTLEPLEPSQLLRRDPDPGRTGGPLSREQHHDPASVWITAESLGDRDPALAAHPQKPVLFVFDEPLLAGLQLSAKRLVFLAETLAELGGHREVRLMRGVPGPIVAASDAAVTFAPVPGFNAHRLVANPAELFPWPWLHRPGPGSISSFSAWRTAVGG